MATIVTRLVAQISGFTGPMNTAEKKVQSFSRNSQRDFQQLGAGIQRLGGILSAVFVTGALARGLNNVARLGDELAKMSARTGQSVETLNGLTQAAALADVSREQLTVGLFQLNKNLLDTTRNTGEAKTSFAAMGIGATEAAGLLKQPEQAFLVIADRLAAIQDPSIRSAEAMRIFGKSGAQLLPLLNQGSAAIAAQIQEMQRLRPITTEQAKAAEEYNDSLTKLSAAFEGLTQQAVGPLLPALTQLINLFTALTSRSDDVLDRIASLDDYGANLGTFFRGLASGVIVADTAIEALAANLAFLAEGLSQISSGNFSGLGALVEEFRQASRELDEKFIQRQSQLFPEATGGRRKDFTAAPLRAITGGGNGAGDIAGATKGKKNPFEIILANLSPRDPAAALDEILSGLGLEEELLGQEIQQRLRSAFQRVNFGPGTLAATADESIFQAQLDPGNLTKQRTALEDRIAARQSELQLLGQVVEKDRELITLETTLTNLKQQQEEALGRAIVAQGSKDAAARQTAALKPFLDAQTKAERAFELAQSRTDAQGNPVAVRGADLLYRRDILAAERDVAMAQLGQAFGADKEGLSHTIELLTNNINALDKQFNNLNFQVFTEGVEQVGRVLSSTINTMGQGLLLGTQDLEDIWANFLRNLAAQSINRAVDQGISLAGQGLATLLPALGAAAVGAGGGQGQLHLASGGSFVVGGRGGIDTNPVRFMATRGERVTVETVEQQRARQSGGQVTVNIINNTGEKVQQQETRSNGGKRIDVTIGEMSGRDVATMGPLGQAIASRFGLRPVAGGR